jgi:hypothetical protein
MLSKKWGYLFKVLVGNTCGHFSLDMNNPFDQLAGMMKKLLCFHIF